MAPKDPATHTTPPTAAPRFETVPLTSLRPHPRNYRRHTEYQLVELRASIEQHGAYRNVVIAEDGTILAGHGVVEALESMGAAEVNVARMPYAPDDPAAIKLLVGDNELGALAESDQGQLSELLGQLNELGELLGTGVNGVALRDLSPRSDDLYTDVVNVPQYEPVGEPPPMEKLLDESKTEELRAAIAAADLPGDVADYLWKAAARHTVFNYRAAAQFYAHAPAEVQELMEASALVIIDVDNAIAGGFMRLDQALDADFTEGLEDG